MKYFSCILFQALLIMALISCGDKDSPEEIKEPVVEDLTPGKYIIGISAGANHTCAHNKDGLPFCWGDEKSGQLGNNEDAAFKDVPQSPLLLTEIIEITSGANHTCALKKDTTVWCWGIGQHYQLGHGKNTGRLVPYQIPEFKDVTAISAGSYHTCALKKDGTAWCWGLGNSGQLGMGDVNNRFIPTIVKNLTKVTSISAGNAHTCAITEDKNAWCWGRGHEGQLGNNETPTTANKLALEAKKVESITKVDSISVGQNYTCAVTEDGTPYCWGSGNNGQLGNSETPTSATKQELVPKKVESLTKVSSISPGVSHTCAVTKDNLAYCWGIGTNGQLGNEEKTSVLTPTKIEKFTDVTQITTGTSHTCAVKKDGTAWCWGVGSNGQIGNKEAEEKAVPTKVEIPTK